MSDPKSPNSIRVYKSVGGNVSVRDSRGRLQKGSRANPHGAVRTRAGVTEILDQMLGDNALEAYVFAINVMRGNVAAPARKPAPGEDAASAALIPLVGPTVRERLDAAQWLAEQRNGKAPTSATVDVNATVAIPTVRINPERLTAQELEQMESLALKALEEGDTIEGEAVEVQPEDGVAAQ